MKTTIEKYHKKMNEIIAEDIPIEKKFIKMLKYAAKKEGRR